MSNGFSRLESAEPGATPGPQLVFTRSPILPSDEAIAWPNPFYSASLRGASLLRGDEAISSTKDGLSLPWRGRSDPVIIPPHKGG
jgi:hypothetical protein